MITTISASNNRVTPQVDLHARRGVSRRSRHGNASFKKPGHHDKNRIFDNGSLSTDRIPPALAARTKVLTGDSPEESAYFAYSAAPKIFRKLADYCEFGEGPRNYSFKNRIINFLEDRKESGDLENAIFFLYNLETLSNLQNKDGSQVKCVERVFENAEEAIEKGDKVHGFYFEPIAALSMMDAGFSIKEVSVRSIERNGRTEELIDSHNSPREIDFIAEKDFGEGTVKIFCDAKSSVVSLIMSNLSSKQTDALVELADKYDAVPAIILKTRDAKVSSDGTIDHFQGIGFSRKHRKQICRFLTDYPGLLIWDESGNNIATDKELSEWERSHNQPKVPLVA